MEAREILGAEHLGIEFLRIGSGKGPIGEVNQDDETTEVFKVKVRQVNVALSAAHIPGFHFLQVNDALAGAGKQSQFGCRALALVVGKHLGRHQLAVLELGVNIGAVLIELDGIAIGCGVKTVELVTIQLNGY